MKPFLEKPKTIYIEKWVLIVAYRQYEVRMSDYEIPEPFSNMGIHPCSEEELLGHLKTLITEYKNEVGTIVQEEDWYFYYKEMQDIDNCTDVEDMLSRINSEGVMSIDEYNQLIRELPDFKEYKFPVEPKELSNTDISEMEDVIDRMRSLNPTMRVGDGKAPWALAEFLERLANVDFDHTKMELASKYWDGRFGQ